MDLTGIKFNKLTPVKRIVEKHRTYYKCVCDCGNEKIIFGGSLTSGATKSCGCMSRTYNYTEYKHGHAKKRSKEYSAWLGMKQRCCDINNKDYEKWGGRGIKVCERWLNNFENFLADMGKAPTKDHSIDRIDNNGNYEPGNVRWTTDKEQANNRSTSTRAFI